MKLFISAFMLLLVYIPTTAYGQPAMEPICLTCETADLIADVYIVPPDGIQGQLISGQFYKIAGLYKEAEVTYENFSCFLESKGREFIKIGGGAYLIITQNDKHYLAEVIRKDESHFEPLRVISMNDVIKDAPFINVILPRSGNDIYSSRR